MKVGVIVTAGGAGKRMGVGQPKQYISLAGTPIFIVTLSQLMTYLPEAFFVFVCPSGDRQMIANQLIAHAIDPEKVRIVEGGTRRQDSVRHGFRVVPSTCEAVLVHDAVRPFVRKACLFSLLQALVAMPAVIVGRQAVATMKEVDAQGKVVKTLNRDRVYAIQTPQGFRRDVLAACYARVDFDIDYTDEAAMVEANGVSVQVIAGNTENIKITEPHDLKVAEAIYACWHGI